MAKQGDLVTVLHFSPGVGTSLSAPTEVLDVRKSESGRRHLFVALDVAQPDVHPQHGEGYWTPDHPDFVGVVKVCKGCSQPLEKQGGVWVSTVSGDHGGTYDICPEGTPRYENDVEPPHQPR